MQIQRPSRIRQLLRWLSLPLLLVGGYILATIVLDINDTIKDRMPEFAAWQQQNFTTMEAILWAIAFILLAYSFFRFWQQSRANAWHREGLALTQRRHYRRALEAYDHALAIRPRFAGTWTNKRIVLMRLKDYDGALAAIAKAISLKPKNNVAWLNKGVILLRIKRYDEALAATEKSLSLDHKNAIAWNNKADILCEHLKRHEEAILVCDEAQRRHIEMAGLWAIKGAALQALGHEDEANAAYGHVLTYPAEDFVSWAARAKALAGVKRYDEALTAYDQALNLRPDEPRLWHERAAVLRALGRDAEAEEAEARANELDG